MSTRFNVQFGQDLCDMLHAELALVCNFMDAGGRITASSERGRIGQVHPVALRIMQGELDEYSVTAEEAAREAVAREGVLTAIDLDGERLACFSIAGPLPVVRPLARIVRFCVMALLQTAQAGGHAGALPAAPTAAPATSLGELMAHASSTVGFSLARLHQAIEHVGEGVALVDEALRLVVWNQRFLELSGCSEEEARRGASLPDIAARFIERHGMNNTLERERLAEHMARLRTGQGNDFELQTPQGLVLAITDRPLPGGGAVSTFADVTERHRSIQVLRSARQDAERMVAERTEQLTQILANTPLAMFVVDAEERVTHWNRACAALLGIDAAKVIGSRELWRVCEDEPRPTLAGMVVRGAPVQTIAEIYPGAHPSRLIEGGVEVEIYLNYMSHPGNSGFWAYMTAAPLYDAQGAPCGAVQTLQDVGEQRRVQQLLLQRSNALQQANADMEYQVRERTDALRHQLMLMRQLVEAIPGPVFYKDTSDHYLGCNSAFAALVGRPPEAIVGRTMQEIMPPPLRDRIRRADEALCAQPGAQTFEAQVPHANGQLRDMLFHRATFTHANGELAGLVGVLLDITERKRMEDGLRQAATFFDNSVVGMMISGPDGTVQNVNASFTRITGYSRDEVMGRHVRMFKSGRQPRSYLATARATIARHGSWQGEVWNKRKNGEVHALWLSISEVRDEAGEVVHHVSSFSDLSQQKDAEERIEHLAYTDLLTQLPNRRRLLDRLDHALALSTHNRHHGALLLIDIDEFKSLNDTRGHDAGDQLLQQAAKRLSSCVNEGDTVARLGGDEFAVLLEGLSTEPGVAVAQVQAMGDQLRQALDHPYALGAAEHHHSASIGVAVFGRGQGGGTEMLKQAEMAMYRAKTAGRNTLAFFDPEMQAALGRRTALEQALRNAVHAQEFTLHYQPQVDDAGMVLSVEALLRWPNAQGGAVSPAEFIPLAERTGLILPLGRWVLDVACRQIKDWANMPDTAALTVAVNVSVRQFHHPDFVDQVLDALAHSGANPARLKLELTESLLIEDVETVIGKMQTLKERGVGFSLDDFGTGYSSLAYLKRLPLDQLKIDQSFVRDVLVDANDAAIARMVVALADSLGLQVVAEGVESMEQRSFLSQHGCDAYQGFLFSPALPADALQRWVAERAEPLSAVQSAA